MINVGNYGSRGSFGWCVTFGKGWSTYNSWWDRLVHGDANLIAWRTYWYGLACLAFGWRCGPSKRLMVDIGPFAFEVRS